MKKISPGFILPSAAYTVKKNAIKFYEFNDRKPQVGDLVYGRIIRLGQHSGLENKNGRIHVINDGSRAVFVYGNRYAPDHFEGYVPDTSVNEVDMLAQSGVVGVVHSKNSMIKDPTRVRVLGQVCDEQGEIINTRNYPLIVPNKAQRPDSRRSLLILIVGTAMNSGKSMAAAACCWALSAMGHEVRGSKITGTASL